MDLVDRASDFYRRRSTRCAACGHEQAFDAGWFERWNWREEACPGCGVDCTAEQATRLVANPDDPALDDRLAVRLSWWHTSACADWPSAVFDPMAQLSTTTRRRMGGESAARRWAARQKAKALHVGTYEAAIQNMLRRIDRQGDAGRPFYLYRVRLRSDVVIAAGCGDELVDFVGDVALSEACPLGIDVTRYVNLHEDPGGVSLALGRQAIHSVQRLRIPLEEPAVTAWRASALRRLRRASKEPVAVVEPDNAVTRLRLRLGGPTLTSARRQEQIRLRDEVTEHLPAGLRDQVRVAVAIDDEIEPARWCDDLAAIVELIDDAEAVVSRARAADSIAVQ